MNKLQLKELISRFEWDEAKSYGNIGFIPIVGKLSSSSLGIDVATDKIEGIKISELESESVNQVNIESEYDSPLLVVPGIIFEGGRQTRSPTRPFIIHKGTKRTIPVNCIEQNRWAYTPEAKVTDDIKQFKFSSKYVNRKTKSSLTSHAAEQSATWGNISEMRASAGLSMEEAASSNQMEIESIAFEKSSEKIKEIRTLIASSFNLEEQRGIVIVEKGKLVSIEVFESSDLWDKVANNVLESNLFELLQEEAQEDQTIDEVEISMDDFEIEPADKIADETAYKLKFGDLEGWGVGSGKEQVIYLVINKKVEGSGFVQMQEQIQSNIGVEREEDVSEYVQRRID
ncbi:MAG: ARPP-1 family domain-containing protein [Candidatus Kariarchaeaceae archaeon]